MSTTNAKRKAKRQRARENIAIVRGSKILRYREKSGYKSKKAKKDRRDRDGKNK